MGTKSTTIVTFAVKVQVPKGSNTQELLSYINGALLTHPPRSMEGIPLTVTLQKKETVYGKN